MANYGRDHIAIGVEELRILANYGRDDDDELMRLLANYGRKDDEASIYSSEILVSNDFVMSRKCCIFKTPNILSRHNEKAHAPNAFSIGPWHHGKPHLKATQKIKKNYLHGLICRSQNPKGKLTQLEDAIREVVSDARDCYEGTVEFATEELVKILVLDGCFIIELFRKFFKYDKKVKYEDDPIFTMSCMLQFLQHDLVLLENQIPWFVLELLFDKTKTDEKDPLVVLAIIFFRGTVVPPEYSDQNLKELGRHSYISRSKHILDLLRNWLILPVEEQKSGEGSNQPAESEERIDQTAECGEESYHALPSGENESPAVPCATSLVLYIQKLFQSNKQDNKIYEFRELHCASYLKQAGIRFERRLESKSILDIQFDNGVLKIPTLIVQQTTDTILRNLISLEQCAPNYCSSIISYAKLMDHLIESAKDMEILCQKGIINNWLTLEDASKFFDQLYIDTYVKEYHYNKLCRDVNMYCEDRWPRWRVKLINDYFDNPWAIIGLVAAGLVFLLTIIGTVLSILQVVL